MLLKFSMKMKKMFTKTSNTCSNNWNSKNTFKPTLFQQYSRIKVYNVLALPLFYMEAKFVLLDKRIRNN